MPKKQHLDILMQGVEVWNRWRRDMPDIRPDLRRVKLHGANLFGSDVEPYLSHADLKDAILFDADLSGADLQRAQLQGADLRKANLSRANLRESNLNGAFLMDANLRSVDLRGAMLMEANLCGVNLSDANLLGADLNGMFQDLFDYPWILPLYKYDSLDDLIDSLEEKVIAPAVSKAKDIEERRRELEKELSP